MDELRTERLVGTRPLLRDADELHPICSDPRVARWVWEAPLTLSQTRAMLVRDMDHWKRHRFGRWVWREDGRVVGLAGLLVIEEGVELAWFFAADVWGRGLATESARAAIEFAGPRVLFAKTEDVNVRSRAVMERLGMVYEADIEHAGLPHVLYRITPE